MIIEEKLPAGAIKQEVLEGEFSSQSLTGDVSDISITGTIEIEKTLTGTLSEDQQLTGIIDNGVHIDPILQDKNVSYTPTKSTQSAQIFADSGYDGLNKVSVTVKSIPSQYIVPSGTKNITANGMGIDVTTYAAVNVAVPTSEPILQTKSAIPTELEQIITADSGYDGLDQVNISAISSTYIGSNITRRSSSDITISGATVSIPSGYYSNDESKSVTSGTAGVPTAIKGTVSNHSISVTPSVTNTTGYITGDTKIGTSITVSASELVSGSETKTANGTYDVINLASLVVAVPATVPNLQDKAKIYTPSTSQQIEIISADNGYDGLDEVSITVNSIPSEYIIPSGTKSIVSNGTGIDVTNYASVDVTVPATIPILQDKTVSYTPTEAAQSAIISADNGYDGLDEVTVNIGGISSNYVGTGIIRRDSEDLSVSEATVSVPSGYYSSNATASISAATHNNPTISINSSTGQITASHTQSSGYVTAGTTNSTYNLTTASSLTITPTEQAQTAVASGVFTIGVVSVAAISSDYVGSAIPYRDATDLALIGNTMLAPNGYYQYDTSTTISISTIYTGSSAPSGSLGVDGDIYIQT